MKKKNLLLGLIPVLYFKDNLYVYAQRRSLYDTNLPKAFNNTRIVQITDLHGMVFGPQNLWLLNKVAKYNPDMIFVTGDIVAHHGQSNEAVIALMQDLSNMAPTYFVLGNHESHIPEGMLGEVLSAMKKAGVFILNNKKVTIEKDGEKIDIAGVIDPTFVSREPQNQAVIMAHELDRLDIDPKRYTILLSHRPEMFEQFKEHQINLIFSGHTHGGQVRLPLHNAIYVPHQGLFPKYDEGYFTDGKTTMYVSRGLGHSGFPVRVSATPEIVVMTLKSETNFKK